MTHPRRRVGTFDRLTRVNVAAGCAALAAAVLAVGCWRAGIGPWAALAAGAGAGAAGAVGWELRRGAAGHPGGILALYAGWLVLLGPIAWLAASTVWS